MVFSPSTIRQDFAIDQEPFIRLAIEEIRLNYGREVSVGLKRKTLNKFGRKIDGLQGDQTVWEVPAASETYLTPNNNLITHLSSSNAADTMSIAFEGHFYDAGDLVFGAETVALTGQTPAALSRGYARCSRLRAVDGPAGDVWAHQNTSITAGVPTDFTTVHNVIKGTDNRTQSYKCATTLSYRDWGILTTSAYGIARKQGGAMDFELLIKLQGETAFTPVYGQAELDTGATSFFQQNYKPFVIIPANSDLRVQFNPSITGMQANASFSMLLALDREYANDV